MDGGLTSAYGLHEVRGRHAKGVEHDPLHESELEIAAAVEAADQLSAGFERVTGQDRPAEGDGLDGSLDETP